MPKYYKKGFSPSISECLLQQKKKGFVMRKSTCVLFQVEEPWLNLTGFRHTPGLVLSYSDELVCCLSRSKLLKTNLQLGHWMPLVTAQKWLFPSCPVESTGSLLYDFPYFLDENWHGLASLKPASTKLRCIGEHVVEKRDLPVGLTPCTPAMTYSRLRWSKPHFHATKPHISES